MKLDSSKSLPIADEDISGGTKIAEADNNQAVSGGEGLSGSLPWCYLKTHPARVAMIESLLVDTKRFNCFVHRTSHYTKKQGSSHVQQTCRETVSGLLFIQGRAQTVQQFLNERLVGCYLAKDCSTREVAVIPHSQMVPFMHVAETDPDRVRTLLKPFEQYAKDNTLLRILSGPLAGMEGYVIRIGRERCLVMNIGGQAVAIQGIHKEMFEIVKE